MTRNEPSTTLFAGSPKWRTSHSIGQEAPTTPDPVAVCALNVAPPDCCSESAPPPPSQPHAWDLQRPCRSQLRRPS